MPHLPQLRGRISLGLAALWLTACSTNVPQGPPFDEAFPDASVLVTTSDPRTVLAQLQRCQLPATRAHQDRLVALLQSRPQVTAAQLALLTRAVALSTVTMITGSDQLTWRYGPRGKGDQADAIERLLGEGIDRISDIDRYWFGQLIGVSQTDATLRRYCDRFLARVDDGSPRALGEMLDGMPGSPAAIPFLAGYQAPKGGLDGERGWLAFARMAFDSQRTELLQALLGRDPAVDGERLVAVMKAYSFDSGRQEAFAMLAHLVQPLSVEHATASLATFSFDSGREAAFARLGKQRAVQLHEQHLLAFVKLCSFDSGKLQCIQTLAGCLHGEPAAADARSVLAAFSFDTDRLAALEVMAPRWRQLPAADRQPLLDTFSFDSNKKQATRLLQN